MRSKTTLQIMLPSTLPLLLALGCAHQQPEPGSFSPVPPILRPTSRTTDQRVYSTTITAPTGAEASVTEARPGAAGAGWDLAETIRQMLIADQNLAAYASKVIATVDPKSPGTVVLSGSVPSGGAKRKLHDRVGALPGVTRVENKLVVGLPDNPSELDLRGLTK